MDLGLGFRVWVLGLRTQGFGLWVRCSGSGFGVKSLGFEERILVVEFEVRGLGSKGLKFFDLVNRA